MSKDTLPLKPSNTSHYLRLNSTDFDKNFVFLLFFFSTDFPLSFVEFWLQNMKSGLSAVAILSFGIILHILLLTVIFLCNFLKKLTWLCGVLPRSFICYNLLILNNIFRDFVLLYRAVT